MRFALAAVAAWATLFTGVSGVAIQQQQPVTTSRAPCRKATTTTTTNATTAGPSSAHPSPSISKQGQQSKSYFSDREVADSPINETGGWGDSSGWGNDGGWDNYGIRIATNSFNLKEVELLNEAIKSKYNLETTIQNI